MEAEIVAMCLRMQVSSFAVPGPIGLIMLYRYNHPDGAGSTTSGGTESILMSCKTHRDWALATKGVTEPEMYDNLLFLGSLVLTSTYA
jgi:sphinganine-1-phosphate aldolase